MAQQHGTAQWLAGRQPKGQQHEQARCVSPSPSLFFSIGMDMQCQHKSHLLTRSRPLPPSFSLFSWLGTGGIHAEQLCSWPWPPRHACLPVAHTTTTQTRHVCRRTPSSCCGVEGGMPANCACVCVCVPHPAASTTLHPVRVGAHICVLIFLEAHCCPLLALLFFVFFHHHVMWRRGRVKRKEAEQPCRAEQSRRAVR